MPHASHPKLIFYAVCAVALMSTIGVSLPYPILAPLFVDAPPSGFNHFLGLPPKLLLGLALALNPLGFLLGSMVMGVISDHFGRRRIMLGSLGLTFIGHAATAIALMQGWYPLFLLARFATGLTEGNVVIARAIVADLHPTVERTHAFAQLNSCLYIGWLIGPLLGGATLVLGASVPFWLSALAILICACLLVWLLPRDAGGQLAPTGMTQLWQVARENHALRLLSDPRLRQVFYLQLMATMGVTAFYDFYPVWLVEFAHMNSMQIALVTAAMCLLMSTSSILIGRIGDGVPPLVQARRYALIMGLVLCLQPWLLGWPGVVLMIALGLPISLYNAVMPAYFSERFGAVGQGSIMGLLTTTFCLANVVVALVGSVLILLDTRLILLLGGMFCMVAAILLGRWMRVDARHTPNPSAPSKSDNAVLDVLP